MARQLRSELQTGWHHITNRGIDRRAVFRSDADRVDFGALLGAACATWNIQTLAYCLMDNHYHLIVSCPNGGLSEFMQDIGAKFTRHANERTGGDGPIFRSRFFSRAIRTERYLGNAVRYVHRNPADIRPPVALSQFRWCSHRTYLGHRRCPEWLSCSPVLDWFETPEAFDRFVSDDIDAPRCVTADAQDVLGAVAFVADTVADDLDRARRGLLRTATYLVLDRVDPRCRDELISWLGPSSPEALRQAIWRAERSQRDEPRLQELADAALLLLSSGV